MGSNSFISLVCCVHLFLSNHNYILRSFDVNRALYTYHFQKFIPSFENSVDPDQLASKKPADQDPHCFYINAMYLN